MTEKAKARRNAPRKKTRVPREIEAMLNRAQRRQQQETLQRLAKRDIYPEPEADTEYRP